MEIKISSLEMEAESLRALLNQLPPLIPPIIDVSFVGISDVNLPPRKRIKKMVQEKNNANTMMLSSQQLPVELQRHQSWSASNGNVETCSALHHLDTFSFPSGSSEFPLQCDFHGSASQQEMQSLEDQFHETMDSLGASYPDV